jgi:hypothetical protein
MVPTKNQLIVLRITRNGDSPIIMNTLQRPLQSPLSSQVTLSPYSLGSVKRCWYGPTPLLPPPLILSLRTLRFIGLQSLTLLGCIIIEQVMVNRLLRGVTTNLARLASQLDTVILSMSCSLRPSLGSRIVETQTWYGQRGTRGLVSFFSFLCRKADDVGRSFRCFRSSGGLLGGYQRVYREGQVESEVMRHRMHVLYQSNLDQPASSLNLSVDLGGVSSRSSNPPFSSLF